MNFSTMNLIILIAAISFLYGLLFIFKIRSYDIYEKEPFWTMAFTTIWGGIWSVVISLILYHYLGKIGISDIQNSLGAIFIIGPVEESSKLLALFSGYFIYRKDLNEPLDGLVYISCVSLGFSIIENFFYIIASESIFLIMTLRILLCTPAHIIFSLFMGLAFYNLIVNKSGYLFLLLTIILSSLAHGLYDLMVFNGLFVIMVIITLKLTHMYAMIFLRYSAANSSFRETFINFITNYKNPKTESGLKCLYCGSAEPKPTYQLHKIRVQKCDSCEHYICSKDSLFYIFHHFGAAFKKLSKNAFIDEEEDNEFYTLYKSNYFSATEMLAFFKLEELNEAIEEFAANHTRVLKKQFWYRPGLIP